MLQSVVVVLERTAGVVRWVDVDALDLPRELLLQRLQREQVVSLDQAVVEDVVVRDALGIGCLLYTSRCV